MMKINDARELDNVGEHGDTLAARPDCEVSMMPTLSRPAVYVLLTLTYLFGALSLLFWLAFLFHGSLDLVNLGLGETPALCLNACLSLAFFAQHSVMIRPSFRQWMARFVRTDYHGALYTIASGIVLLSLVVFWQRSAHTWVMLEGVPRLLAHAVFLLAFVGFNWGTRALGSFDMFGTGPIVRRLRSEDPPPPMPFTIRGPYRWVRHPLYLFCLLMIWSCPDLTADRLLYNVLWTGWIIVGTVLEERNLMACFGEAYHDYRSKVPMLIPRSIRPVQ
jgi:protein-S-isoprenylcysteine O-methyltransferase Ste14